MCGIIGAVAERDVIPILLQGLKRLEYRGYDSAGIAVTQGNNDIARSRTAGKVAQLEALLDSEPMRGVVGIAHTRWATHGEPNTRNAHPHLCNKRFAVVHNGIIENFELLREQQKREDYLFTSETDTEVVVHQIHKHYKTSKDLLSAVQLTTKDLLGAYALGVLSSEEPDRMIAARLGSPLVLGVGIGEYFIASEVSALLPVTQRFIYLEEGDIADIRRDTLTIYNADGNVVTRPIKESKLTVDAVERGNYRHFMLKEIFEQPHAISQTLLGCLDGHRVIEESFGHNAKEIFDDVQGVHILACGTSYHAGMVARYWLESISGIPCSIEIASEFRYRKPIVRNNSLVVTISQSGETADTLAALKEAKKLGFGKSLVICNVPESALVRESDLVFLTRAGPEIGVASTKAFTTQLVGLLLLAILLGRRHRISDAQEEELVKQLLSLPAKVERVLEQAPKIEALAEDFADKHHALFLGRGAQYPIAMEGALKLKEISYIHAEAYPAGELKHGPLALVDADMPIIAVAPNNELLEKLKSNLQEVRARGGILYVFADEIWDEKDQQDSNMTFFNIESTPDTIAPIVYTVPLQLLSYYVAILKGTDVDQPRNLAKSVTVE